MAAQGPIELRRFIERTRAIYGLYYWDYVRRERDALATEPASGPPEVAASLTNPNPSCRIAIADWDRRSGAEGCSAD